MADLLIGYCLVGWGATTHKLEKILKLVDYAALISLGAIWGASFLFMRIAAPEMGAIGLVTVRMVSAALFLSPLLFFKEYPKIIIKNWKWLLSVAILSNVAPFALLAFSSTRLEAGFTSLLNATVPVWTALIGFSLFANKISRQQFFGLFLAFLGVFTLSANRMSFSADGPGWAILAGLLATFCYGLSIHIVKRHLSEVPPMAISLGAVSLSALILVVPGYLYWPDAEITTIAWASSITLGMLCTGLAFLIFFPLIKRTGPMISASITFLVPIFAITWGVILLDEVLTSRMILGMLLTFLGTGFVLNLFPVHRLGKSVV